MMSPEDKFTSPKDMVGNKYVFFKRRGCREGKAYEDVSFLHWRTIQDPRDTTYKYHHCKQNLMSGFFVINLTINYKFL